MGTDFHLFLTDYEHTTRQKHQTISIIDTDVSSEFFIFISIQNETLGVISCTYIL